MKLASLNIRKLLVSLAAIFLLCAVASAKSRKKEDSQQLREEYVARLQQQGTVDAVPTTTPGSLWVPNAPLGQLGSDVKARAVNDTILIRVTVNTFSSATGTVNSQRDFQTSSAITGLAGQLSTRGVNPIINAKSSTQLKGTGQAGSTSNLQTNVGGQVIAVLPSGNLVVEAERQVLMNNQRETVVVRGVARPIDIDNFNSISSTALTNLEIELKGKGIVSDSTRPPNPITRFLLRIIGF